MNPTRLEKLKHRAERATTLAALIAKLQDADPHADGASLEFSRRDMSGQYHQVVEHCVLADLIDRGRKAVIESAEAELESLLAVEPHEEEARPG
jgi:hypothetical protein